MSTLLPSVWIFCPGILVLKSIIKYAYPVVYEYYIVWHFIMFYGIGSGIACKDPF